MANRAVGRTRILAGAGRQEARVGEAPELRDGSADQSRACDGKTGLTRSAFISDVVFRSMKGAGGPEGEERKERQANDRASA